MHTLNRKRNFVIRINEYILFNVHLFYVPRKKKTITDWTGISVKYTQVRNVSRKSADEEITIWNAIIFWTGRHYCRHPLYLLCLTLCIRICYLHLFMFTTDDVVNLLMLDIYLSIKYRIWEWTNMLSSTWICVSLSKKVRYAILCACTVDDEWII